MQSLVEFAQYAVLAQQGCDTSDLARGPHSPVVGPPVVADALRTVKQVGAPPLSVSVGRSTQTVSQSTA
ncbi:MAG TPA: hypothetical protein VE197_18095 [Mycobacterium sp.]|nr:hypothetical protein [Mycobacterium sp.]